MKAVIINGSPRKNGNTVKLCNAFAEGICKSHPECEINFVHLYDYTYKGCVSCFSCKLRNSKNYGQCALQDDLSPILRQISNADCLVLASPIYLMDVTGFMKSFLERLCFPYGSYEYGYRSLAPKGIQTVTIYTMNCLPENAPVSAMDNVDRFIGHIFTPPKRLCAYNTYQFSDYSKYVAEIFSETDKAQYRSKFFLNDIEKAFQLGYNQ